MSHVITVQSHTSYLDDQYNAIDIYNSLRKSYAEEEIFLLESMNGPAKDCTQSIVAFESLFTISITGQSAIITGNSELVDRILTHPLLQEYAINNNQIDISGQDVIALLRNIEKVFLVNHSGVPATIYFGFFGYFGYDAIFFFEDLAQKITRNQGYADISLTLYRHIINLNVRENTATLTVNNSDFIPAITSHQLTELLSADTSPDEGEYDFSYTACPTIKKQHYFDWFKKAKAHIDIGDIYQIQLGHEIKITSNLTPYQVYCRLRQYNPSPYMYFFKTVENVYVIGASPEMFITLTKASELLMRPIAGTIRNSADPLIKEQNRQKLLADEKERAEHLMLVDLCRNDIARICQPSSLKVDELIITEEYSHVIHLVSNVSAILQTGLDKYDALAASFPAGTMSGTPKIRAMEIIEDTEISSRGIYAGCVGFWGINNIILTALCIRTAVYHNGQYTIRASGGIVEDSTQEGEWNETISKLSSTYFAITDKELNSENFIN